MRTLNDFTAITGEAIARAKRLFGSPIYLYDERLIAEKCAAALQMPHAYGLTVRFAMKANPNRAILRIIHGCGLGIDASSLNEAIRAHMAGIEYRDIILTTQEVPSGEERAALQRMMLEGLKYNVCSLRQLDLIGAFAAKHKIDLSIRVHPGVGSGESASRNTGDDYSCFGIHQRDIPEAVRIAAQMGVRFAQVHTHIGSGGDPDMWRQNIDLELDTLERDFPHASSISFGGGFCEVRMPGEKAADIEALGLYAKAQIEAFHHKTGRKLKMEIEPGTFITANAGYMVTEVLDKKSTGPSGFNFIVMDGGMELNARPLMYGSRHPFYVISKDGELLSSQFDAKFDAASYCAIPVGRCCESGDSQSLDEAGLTVPRAMAEPEIGDILVVGGVGAYCAAMSPYNYNSHTQAPEVLLTRDGQLKLIRKAQTLGQIVENELD